MPLSTRLSNTTKNSKVIDWFTTFAATGFYAHNFLFSSFLPWFACIYHELDLVCLHRQALHEFITQTSLPIVLFLYIFFITIYLKNMRTFFYAVGLPCMRNDARTFFSLNVGIILELYLISFFLCLRLHIGKLKLCNSFVWLENELTFMMFF